MNLQDKVVVITGASRGLGEELAKVFASHGARVVISGRDENNLQQVAKETGAEYVVCDVTNENDVIKLAEKIVGEHHRIDIWVNNAGIWMKHGPVTELDTVKLHQVMEVNFFGLVYGSKAALAQMLKRHEGIIVNIISTSALEGRLWSAGYSASKFAADGFTKSLQLESSQSGIKTIAIYPGGMQTHLFDEKKPAEISEFMSPASVAEKIVANLETTTPEEVLIIKRPK